MELVLVKDMDHRGHGEAGAGKGDHAKIEADPDPPGVDVVQPRGGAHAQESRPMPAAAPIKSEEAQGGR